MRTSLILASLALLSNNLVSAETVSLGDLNLDAIQQGWGKPGANLAVSGQKLQIAGKSYASGIGTHAPSTTIVTLDKAAEKLSAYCGVDDGAQGKGSVRFQVYGDGRSLWQSPVMKSGDAAVPVSLDIKGVRTLVLLVTDAGDGMEFDHANWADVSITYAGAKPSIVAPAKEEKTILTPPASPAPRINSPAVFGVRPGSPVLCTIAASGERPMTFSVEKLPAGLSLDANTGVISGKLPERGTHNVTLRAKNAKGATEKKLRIEVGDKIALTPPMGWNSWYCWSESVSDQHIRTMADAMKKSGLADYGWTYIVIDDCWQGERGGPMMAIQPNAKFGDMPALTDYVHKLGLKIGLYSSPWMGTYAGFIGGSAPNEQADYSSLSVPPEKRGQPTQIFGTYPGTHRQKSDRVGPAWFMDKDARQWAEWGFDFVKLDWDLKDTSLLKPSYDAVRAAPRDIVISLSNTAQVSKGAEYPKYSEMWRTSVDIREVWSSVSAIGFAQPVWQQHLSPGTWPDPDMLQVGQLGHTGALNTTTHPSKLSPNEQYTQLTLWTMLQAPLILSCDISAMDDFTRGLLTNAEVLEINQDPAAKPMKVFSRDEEMQTEIWTKPLADGSLAVAFFNKGEIDIPVSVSLQKLGLSDTATVRDCWRQQDLAAPDGVIETVIGRHGCALYRIK